MRAASKHPQARYVIAVCMYRRTVRTESSGNCLLILFGSYRNNTELFRGRDTVAFRSEWEQW